MSELPDAQSNEVCIVDDDPSVLKSMQYLLASEGFKVRPFNKAQDFLAHAGAHHVPVVVTDIWMDEVTGLELLARLCAISPRTKVIVITARPNQYDHAQKMRIDALMEKPLDLPLLLQTINHLIVEPDEERIRRITDRNFRTALLNPLNRPEDSNGP